MNKILIIDDEIDITESISAILTDDGFYCSSDSKSEEAIALLSNELFDLIILETSVPENYVIKFFYFLFSRSFIPFMGSLFSKDKTAYQYLQKSAEKFPSGKKFVSVLKQCGFANVIVKPQMLGATSIYIANKKD